MDDDIELEKAKVTFYYACIEDKRNFSNSLISAINEYWEKYPTKLLYLNTYRSFDKKTKKYIDFLAKNWVEELY